MMYPNLFVFFVVKYLEVSGNDGTEPPLCGADDHNCAGFGESRGDHKTV